MVQSGGLASPPRGLTSAMERMQSTYPARSLVKLAAGFFTAPIGLIFGAAVGWWLHESLKYLVCPMESSEYIWPRIMNSHLSARTLGGVVSAALWVAIGTIFSRSQSPKFPWIMFWSGAVVAMFLFIAVIAREGWHTLFITWWSVQYLATLASGVLMARWLANRRIARPAV